MPRAAPAAHARVDLVAMDQRAAAAALRREAVGDHRDDRVEVCARQIAIRPGARAPARTARPRRTRGRPSRRRSAAPARRAARRA